LRVIQPKVKFPYKNISSYIQQLINRLFYLVIFQDENLLMYILLYLLDSCFIYMEYVDVILNPDIFLITQNQLCVQCLIYFQFPLKNFKVLYLYEYNFLNVLIIVFELFDRLLI